MEATYLHKKFKRKFTVDNLKPEQNSSENTINIIPVTMTVTTSSTTFKNSCDNGIDYDDSNDNNFGDDEDIKQEPKLLPATNNLSDEGFSEDPNTVNSCSSDETLNLSSLLSSSCSPHDSDYRQKTGSILQKNENFFENVDVDNSISISEFQAVPVTNQLKSLDIVTTTVTTKMNSALLTTSTNASLSSTTTATTNPKNVCQYCNLICTKPSVLQKHIRSHTNERPYPCDTCDFSFKTVSNLYKHYRSWSHVRRLKSIEETQQQQQQQQEEQLVPQSQQNQVSISVTTTTSTILFISTTTITSTTSNTLLTRNVTTLTPSVALSSVTPLPKKRKFDENLITSQSENHENDHLKPYKPKFHSEKQPLLESQVNNEKQSVIVTHTNDQYNCFDNNALNSLDEDSVYSDQPLNLSSSKRRTLTPSPLYLSPSSSPSHVLPMNLCVPKIQSNVSDSISVSCFSTRTTNESIATADLQLPKQNGFDLVDKLPLNSSDGFGDCEMLHFSQDPKATMNVESLPMNSQFLINNSIVPVPQQKCSLGIVHDISVTSASELFSEQSSYFNSRKLSFSTTAMAESVTFEDIANKESASVPVAINLVTAKQQHPLRETTANAVLNTSPTCFRYLPQSQLVQHPYKQQSIGPVLQTEFSPIQVPVQTYSEVDKPTQNSVIVQNHFISDQNVKYQTNCDSLSSSPYLSTSTSTSPSQSSSPQPSSQEANKNSQIFPNSNYISFMDFKSSTKSTYCTSIKTQPFYTVHIKKLSMYSEWRQQDSKLDVYLYSGLIYRTRDYRYSIARGECDANILVHSSYKSCEPPNCDYRMDELSSEDQNQADFYDNDGDNNDSCDNDCSSDDFVYIRGRGRGKYICDQCGIRCRKPSILKKHIRTHSDDRPFTCQICNYSFKTKGNLTKHMKSKAHFEKFGGNYFGSSSSNDIQNENGEDGTETISSSDSEDSENDLSDDSTSIDERNAAECLLNLSKCSNTSVTSSRSEQQWQRQRQRQQSPISPSISETNEKREMPIVLSAIGNETNDETRRNGFESKPMTEISKPTAVISFNHIVQNKPDTYQTVVEPQLLSQQRETEKHKQESSIVQNIQKLIIDPNNSITDGSVDQVTVEEDSKTALANINNSSRSSPLSRNQSGFQDSITLSTNNSDQSAMQTLADAAVKRSKLEKNHKAKNVASEFLKIATQIDQQQQQQQQQQHQSNLVNIVGSTNSTYSSSSSSSSSSSTTTLSSISNANTDQSTSNQSTAAANILINKLEENKNCTICFKTFSKPSQLRLHMNIHYLERPFRCETCSKRFRSKGHLQKHERSASHNSKLTITTPKCSSEPRPFKCSDCSIAFRIHGHLAKHLRSKMHIMKLECLSKIPFGLYTELERSNRLLTEINTIDSNLCLESLKNLAKKLFLNDPVKLNQFNCNNSTS